MRLKTIDEKIITERLSKFEGRHLRLLNRLATKSLKEKISSKNALKNVNNELKKYFESENRLIKGVASSIYSKLNGTIKYTRFNGANLGLVVEKDDVNTNYRIKDLNSFMENSGIYNLGSGTARSFRDLAENTFKALNLEPNIEFIDTPEDIRDKYQYFTEANMQKLKKIGYQNSFNTLESGVFDYVQNYLAKNAIY